MLVPNNHASVCRSSTPVSRSTSSNSQCRYTQPMSTNSTCHLAYLGRYLDDIGVSSEARDLIVSACRDSTNKNYNSAWRKWELLCIDQTNPILAPIEAMVSFLVAKIESFDVGKHPLIHSLMKGAFTKCQYQSTRQLSLLVMWSPI